MAICTPDHALPDLCLNTRPSRAALNQPADVRSFCLDVVELEDGNVGLSTIDARMGGKIDREKLSISKTIGQLVLMSSLIVQRPILLIVLPRIRPGAGLAVRLQLGLPVPATPRKMLRR